MQKFVVTQLFLLLFVSVICAQEQETLITTGDIDHGGYGALSVKISQINQKSAVLVGGYGGWLINHSFLIGGGGYGLANMIEADPEIQAISGDDRILDIRFGYGGFIFEYIGNPENIVHYSGKILLGVGGVGYALRDDYNVSDTKQSACFVSELEAGIEVNVTTFMRINLGAGYRFVNGVDLDGLTDDDLSAVNGRISFKFGRF